MNPPFRRGKEHHELRLATKFGFEISASCDSHKEGKQAERQPKTLLQHPLRLGVAPLDLPLVECRGITICLRENGSENKSTEICPRVSMPINVRGCPRIALGAGYFADFFRHSANPFTKTTFCTSVRENWIRCLRLGFATYHMFFLSGLVRKWLNGQYRILVLSITRRDSSDASNDRNLGRNRERSRLCLSSIYASLIE
jgi:hypothetical protein